MRYRPQMPPCALLLQPDSNGRISGGYLYNREMARHGAWDLWEGSPDALPEVFARLEHDTLILDSLWLTERDLPVFWTLGARGVRVGALIHALPSRIASAESGHVAEGPSEFERAALAKLDFCVVPGPFYAELLAPWVRKIYVCEPGVDPAWRAAPRPRGAVCELVSVGAVTRLKGFLEVLDVFPGLAAARAKLRWTVVGSLEADREYAAQFAERARAFPSVVLGGQRAPEEVRALVQRADVLLMPSREENHPLVLLEALAASVPSVAYAVGASARIIEHGVTGLIAPNGDSARFSACIEELVRDEPRRYAMARACFTRVPRIPSWSKAAQLARSLLAGAATPQS